MSQPKGQKWGEEGFTLFELLIVIIILSILAGIVAFSVGTSKAGALTSACASDAKAVGTALEQYKTQVGNYPPLGPVPGTPYTYLTTSQVVAGQTVGPFLRQLPSTSHYQIVTDSLGNVFVYPAAHHIPAGPGTMSSTDVGLEVFGDPTQDTEFMNFGTNPAICSDANVVS